MPLPTELQTILDKTLRQLTTQGGCLLYPYHRKKIYNLIDTFEPPLNQKMHGWLAYLTSTHLQPVWEKDIRKKGEKNLAPDIWKLTEEVLLDKTSIQIILQSLEYRAS
jgi:hypothetical protein